MAVLGVTKFERFLRAAAKLNVDKQDLKRYRDFVNRKIHDLLHHAEAMAKANGRDIVDAQDLPITKGLQECMHAFKKLDGEIQVDPILEQTTPRPPLDLAMRDVTEAKLPEVAGGVSVALA
jgi:histone H3/H4